MGLVGEGIFELVEGHRSVWFFNVLYQSPKDQEVLYVVFHAPEGSESKVRLFGLRSKVKQGEKRGLQVEWFELESEVFSVLPQDSGEVELVFVFLAKLNLGEACGLFDDDFVTDRVVEGGLVSC